MSEHEEIVSLLPINNDAKQSILRGMKLSGQYADSINDSDLTDIAHSLTFTMDKMQTTRTVIAMGIAYNLGKAKARPKEE